MKNLIMAIRVWLRFEDRNEKTYWIGLLMLFAGLTFSYSLFTALTVVGAGLAIESVITSYLAGLLNSKAKE
jgi:hypothetical protein